MAAQADPPEEPIASLQDQMIDGFTASQQDALLSVELAGRSMVDGLARMQGEIAAFVGERLRQDLEAQSEFLRCRDLADMRAVQSRYLRAAIDQYAVETSRLMRLGGEVAARSLERDDA